MYCEEYVAIMGTSINPQKLPKFRPLGDTRKDFPPPWKEPKNHQEADGQKGHQFYEGLKHHDRY
jgi:hypothetical protein